MADYLSDDAAAIVALAGDDYEAILQEMLAHAEDLGFPIVGPAVGRTLRVLARLVSAERVFEFGSGFGYSAAWFAGALPAGGEVVLTDYDGDELETAREFFERGPYEATPRFETGDAMDTFRRYEGPFDVVLIDHDKTQYVDAFELARDELADGGVVVADNMLAGPVDPAGVRATLAGEAAPDEMTAGIADYLEHVRDDPAVESTIVPLGEGIAVSTLR